MSLISRLFLSYVLARLREPSTWRGLALSLTSVGIVVEPSLLEPFVAVGLAVSGLIGAAFPDV